MSNNSPDSKMFLNILGEAPFFVKLSASCLSVSHQLTDVICLVSSNSFILPISNLRRFSDTLLADFKASQSDMQSV